MKSYAIKNGVRPTITTAEESTIALVAGDKGAIFYNTDTDSLRTWDGTAFQDVGGTGADPVVVDMATGINIDFSAGDIFYKTLTGTTTLTASNLVVGKTIKVVITGNYSLIWFSGMIPDETFGYFGFSDNIFYITCIDSTTPKFSTLFNPADTRYSTPQVISATFEDDYYTPIAMPTGAIVGDSIYFFLVQGSSINPTAPSAGAGWTQVYYTSGGSSSPRYLKMSIWHRTVDGTEGLNLNAPSGNYALTGCAVLVRGGIKGVSGSTTTAYSQTSSKTLTPPTGLAGDLTFNMYGIASGNFTSAPSNGYTWLTSPAGNSGISYMLNNTPDAGENLTSTEPSTYVSVIISYRIK